MKTIICGPPHSGKSVFISNLVKLLPSGHYIRINANGDGEGTWSNNPDQTDVMDVRIKGTNSEEDFLRWKHHIENANLDIVIVDIGGRLQDDKIALFEACDSFVVVSNNQAMIDEWITFGSNHGCKCIGTVLSELGTLHEKIKESEPFVAGVMSGLERGHDLSGSVLLNAIANSIVVLSGFNGYNKVLDSNVIDMYDLGIRLGMSRHWKSSSGIDVHNVWYQPDRAYTLYEYLCSFYANLPSCRIYGARSMWASCLIVGTIFCNGTHQIETYGITSDTYIPISPIATGVKTAGGLICSVKESEEYALLSITLPSLFTPKDREEVVLPQLDIKKKLLLSGKIPTWLAMSIILSYKNREKFVHSPGIGFIQVEAVAKKQLGTIISTPEKLY